MEESQNLPGPKNAFGITPSRQLCYFCAMCKEFRAGSKTQNCSLPCEPCQFCTITGLALPLVLELFVPLCSKALSHRITASSALCSPPSSKTCSQPKTGQRKAIVADGHPAVWWYQLLWGQDGRSEMCYPDGTHPSPQKTWGQDAEVVLLQKRDWDSTSAIQGSLRWALCLALGRRSDHVIRYASFAQDRGAGNSLCPKSTSFPSVLRFLG